MLKWKKKEWEENQAGVINPISHIGNGKIGDMEVELSWHPNGLHFDVEDRRATYILPWEELLSELEKEIKREDANSDM